MSHLSQQLDCITCCNDLLWYYIYFSDTPFELTFKMFIKTSRIHLGCLLNLYSNKMDLHCFSLHAGFQLFQIYFTFTSDFTFVLICSKFTSNLFQICFKFVSPFLQICLKIPFKFQKQLFAGVLQNSCFF